MPYLNQCRDPISTVQLAPFAEDHWHRIVTYSPFYVHWTDMLMVNRKRSHRLPIGKVKLGGKIDVNNLKNDDDVLLSQIYEIRRTVSKTSTRNHVNQNSKSSTSEQYEDQVVPLTDNYQVSSNALPETSEAFKNHPSFTELSLINHGPPSRSTTRSNLPHVNSVTIQHRRSHRSSGSAKHQTPLSAQLRQSALSIRDDRSSSPLSISSSKRTISSARSNQNNQRRSQFTTLSNDIIQIENNDENFSGELSSSIQRPRAKSTNSSRSKMNMLKTKNDRTKQKHNFDLKTILVDPWQQKSWKHEIFQESIPNSLDVMNQLCGPSTTFERNLKRDYCRQLNQYRYDSQKA